MPTLTLIATDDLGVYAGPAYEANSEDGPIVQCDYYVEIIRAGGQTFRLTHPFRRHHLAEAQIPVVKARGVLDLDHWVEIEIVSLETRFALYAMAEDEVRHGHRSEADLYHGLP